MIKCRVNRLVSIHVVAPKTIFIDRNDWGPSALPSDACTNQRTRARSDTSIFSEILLSPSHFSTSRYLCFLYRKVRTPFILSILRHTSLSTPDPRCFILRRSISYRIFNFDFLLMSRFLPSFQCSHFCVLSFQFERVQIFFFLLCVLNPSRSQECETRSQVHLNPNLFIKRSLSAFRISLLSKYKRSLCRVEFAVYANECISFHLVSSFILTFNRISQ